MIWIYTKDKYIFKKIARSYIGKNSYQRLLDSVQYLKHGDMYGKDLFLIGYKQ
ncbi:hypothetical protein [Brachyspira hyodysenteriae]|uniref:hypothetical protein n=1 Tax=Brachyspira hyodysenteriae TaxID=159 RepID=UPI0022CDB41B|nr:hypothetical protein [Brachyspira hyodysenteriae]MCZ9885493.1 hypothetical protein [Brachyspira hyodysenteriae]MCZ9960520.1 hypothetical protein [Brachyspira hyodysenteriae]